MPRTVDHIVETHRLARARQDAGLPIWDRRINLKDVFRNEDMTFEQRRDVIVRRIKRSPWYTEQEDYSHLHDVVIDLEEADDAEEFDSAWDEMYDLADIDRVWIATF